MKRRAATRLVIRSRRDSWPTAADEPHPTLMRTLAAPLRRARRLCQEACPGRSRYTYVPGSAAIRSSAGSPPQGEGPVRPGSRTGRVVRRSLLPRGAAAGVGWTVGWCLGTKPVFLGQRHADPVRPPTRLRGVARWTTTDGRSGHGRRPIKATGYRGCGPGRPRRTRGPLTAGCRPWGWPRRLPLGLGSPAAPWLSASRSAGHQRPPSYGACGRRRGPACEPAPTAPWPCPAWPSALAGKRRSARPSGR
jgi:hypothetical protein